MIQPQLVVDASVAIKWLIPEDGSIEARQLSGRFELIAPELIHAECANIVWKKVRRGNMPAAQAVPTIETLVGLGVGLFPLGPLTSAAMELSVKLDHPAYDCFYLALAVLEDCRMITADDRLLRILGQAVAGRLLDHCVPLKGFGL